MSKEKPQEYEGNELNQFERELAALRPRTDELFDGWRETLVRQAALAEQGVGQAVPAVKKSLARSCSHPAGHRYACIHCGSPLPNRGWRRCSWPAVAAASSSVAAALLIMLATGREPTTAQPPPVVTTQVKQVESATDAIAFESQSASIHSSPAEKAIHIESRLMRYEFDEGILSATGKMIPQDYPPRGVSLANSKPDISESPLVIEKILTNRELLHRIMQRSKLGD